VSARKPHGEDSAVARLARLLPPAGPRVVAGIGDDCAAVRASRGLHLLKTDCVVEGRHFEPGTPARAVGWKAACRAVSDIAACGGAPREALVTCVIRREQAGRWLDGLYRGLAAASADYGFRIVGGELARTDGPAVISVAMTGEVAAKNLIRRSGGRPGDVLFVTGALGGSFRSGWHLRFTPRLQEAQWLVRRFRPCAMMDLSDGLAADLPRLARACGTGFVVDPGSIRRRRGASLAQALGDGEDFELLFAVPPRSAGALEAAWPRRFPRVPLTRIGVLAAPGVRRGLGSGRGFDHFTP
jgi:thiamine-monophosphate kinase